MRKLMLGLLLAAGALLAIPTASVVTATPASAQFWPFFPPFGGFYPYVRPGYPLYPLYPRYYNYRVLPAPYLQPWTPAWYQYCSATYRSFNPSTGMFLGYDGRYHFCQ